MRTLLTTGILACLVIMLAGFHKKSKLKLPGEFTYIPGGTFSMDGNGPCAPCNGCDKTVSIYSFYMSRYEVTNAQYRQFYNEVSPTISETERNKISCDTLAWRRAPAYCEPMNTYYYSHPAYNNYPVVNISHRGATMYCKWLQEKIQKENPDHRIDVRLPTKEQWIYAGRAGRSQAIYPWATYLLRNRKGEYMCNYRKVGDHLITRNRESGKPQVTGISVENAGLYTASVKSFYPNDFGLFNICGNAAEMIAEEDVAMGGSWNDFGGDIYICAESKYQTSSPTVGFRPVIFVDQHK